MHLKLATVMQTVNNSFNPEEFIIIMLCTNISCLMRVCKNKPLLNRCNLRFPKKGCISLVWYSSYDLTTDRGRRGCKLNCY